MKKSYHKNAFTLAEVLITLGIIGVVAAITMPTLIQNYQKQVYVNQLKKTYSMLEQGFQKMLADEGVERLSDLPDLKDFGYGSSLGELGVKNVINDIFKRGFLVSFHEDPSDVWCYQIVFNDGSKIIYVSTNGSNASHKSASDCALIKSQGGTMCSYFMNLTLDVNGDKGPNKDGRDRFEFDISDEGKLYPSLGKGYALYNYPNQPLESNSLYWKNSSDACGLSGSKDIGCSARVIENGWKMDY